ncbi:MAG: hypothetical protein RL091_1557 [Verrucomicrobiota bacterium]
MNRPKTGIVVWVVGILLGVIALEGVWLFETWRRTELAVAALDLKNREWERLVGQSPAPSGASLANLKEAVGVLTDELAQRQTGWGTSNENAGGLTAHSSVDSLIALSQLRGRLRKKAEASGVLLGPDEYFGFAALVQGIPPTSKAADLRRQQAEVEFLVETLLASAPRALIGVKREKGEGPAVTETNGRANTSFVLPAYRSLRRDGLIETDALQIEFTGETGTLRRFLNALAESARPVCVRGVEAEPFDESSPQERSREVGRQEELGSRISRFTVVVEFPRPAAGGAG